MIFVPDNDHSVKNGNIDCAVFFNEDEGEDEGQGINHENRGRIFILNINRKGVLVTLDDNFFQTDPLAASLLSSAAAKKIKVEIIVKIPFRATNDVNPTLIGIAVPAT